jgi:CheY-like chemotaxis protein
VEISVRDTGPGIPADQVASIFDLFYQSDGITEINQQGCGIGLALVKEYITLHHGEINVNSSEGRGTEFVIQLPMGKEHLQAGEIVQVPGTILKTPGNENINTRYTYLMDLETGRDKEPSEPGTGKGKDEDNDNDNHIETGDREKNLVLLIEDSGELRQYIRNTLEPHYLLMEAVNGSEGIAIAKDIIPDIIISDIIMPEVDGYALCRHLKNDIKTCHIPIILLTVKAAEESIIRGLETGADDYIAKPFSTKILCARLKNLIDQRRLLQQTLNRDMTLIPADMPISSIDKEFLKELNNVVKAYLPDSGFNVEQLSKKLYIGRTTLYRKIQALTGESPTDFIRSCRLKQGAELLKNNFGTVIEVAFAVGFCNASYFAKCFKEKFQMVPSEYQEKETSNKRESG